VTAQLADDHGAAVNDVDAERAELSAKQIGARSGEAVSMVGDVGGWDAVGRLVSRVVDCYGSLDGLVSNAGRLHTAARRVVTGHTTMRLGEPGWSSAIRVHRGATS
jgi:NAD(P)-dependent dehydrogenase (short-subunit alcohol dehydrogenase family)